jgi:release factor glutamine methyltransferase
MVTNPFSPSEYTAALLLHTRRHPGLANLDSVLEIGTGSGVIMASLLARGAQRALGIDIEASAVQTTQELLRQEGLDGRARVVQGDMWPACNGEQFNLVISNLPQFAAEQVESDGRLQSWCTGGLDGRSLVDRFLRGLPDHLAPGGLVIMTHNVFIDVARTQAMLEPWGLQARIVYSASALLSPQKLQRLSPEVLERFAGRGIHKVGAYWFGDFDILEISWKPDEPTGR